MILVIPRTAWLLNLSAPLDNLSTNQYPLNNPFSAHTRQSPFLLFVMRLPGWYQFSSVQWLSHVQLFATPWTAARQASLSITNWLYSNLWPLSRWCYPTLSSSVVPFSHFQSFPESGSLLNQFFTSGGQSIGVSPSAWVLLMNIQDWFPLGWTG